MRSVCVCVTLDTSPRFMLPVNDRPWVSMCPEETVSTVTSQSHIWIAQLLILFKISDFSQLRYLKIHTSGVVLV